MSFTWPVLGGPIQFPVTRGSDEHLADGQEEAVDIACPTGTALVAVWNAIVAAAVTDPNASACGLQIDLSFEVDNRHYLVRYCHCSQLEVKAGDIVSAGEIIAEAGMTGVGAFAPTGPHLHLAVFVDGTRVRPEDCLSESGGSGGSSGVPSAEVSAAQVAEAAAALDGVWGVRRILTGVDAATAADSLLVRLRKYATELDNLQHGNYATALRSTADELEELSRALLDAVVTIKTALGLQ